MTQAQDETSDWYGQDAATFGDRVAASREQSGLTQKDLARRLGVRTSTVRNWEDDLSEPRANRLSMMAGLLNVSMMWLINGEGEGLEAPADQAQGINEMADVLVEMRLMRADLLQKAEKVGRLEKQMRRLMAQPADA